MALRVIIVASILFHTQVLVHWSITKAWWLLNFSFRTACLYFRPSYCCLGLLMSPRTVELV